jgi:hypothetical protein
MEPGIAIAPVVTALAMSPPRNQKRRPAGSRTAASEAPTR